MLQTHSNYSQLFQNDFLCESVFPILSIIHLLKADKASHCIFKYPIMKAYQALSASHLELLAVVPTGIVAAGPSAGVCQFWSLALGFLIDDSSPAPSGFFGTADTSVEERFTFKIRFRRWSALSSTD